MCIAFLDLSPMMAAGLSAMHLSSLSLALPAHLGFRYETYVLRHRTWVIAAALCLVLFSSLHTTIVSQVTAQLA